MRRPVRYRRRQLFTDLWKTTGTPSRLPYSGRRNSRNLQEEGLGRTRSTQERSKQPGQHQTAMTRKKRS